MKKFTLRAIEQQKLIEALQQRLSEMENKEGGSDEKTY